MVWLQDTSMREGIAAELAQTTIWNFILFDILPGLMFPILFMAVAWAIGSYAERKHLRRIAAGEAELRGVTASNCAPNVAARRVALVGGNVVVANDLFKNWRARVRSIFGGEIKHYQTMVMRGRREAILRLKQEARALGSDHVCGVRLQCTSIGVGNSQGGAVEIYAYGTAIL